MFKGAKLSQDMSLTKSYFEKYLDSECNANSILQLDKQQLF